MHHTQTLNSGIIPGTVLYISHIIKSSKHLLRDCYNPPLFIKEEKEAWRSPPVMYKETELASNPYLTPKFMLLFTLPVLTELFISIVSVGF